MFFKKSQENFAQERARELMNEFGLSHWKFAFNNLKRVIGRTRFPKSGSSFGTIELSRHFIALNARDIVEETIRHELAHAVAFISDGETGHGQAWKRACELTGASPVSTTSVVVMPEGKWVSQCSCCQKKHFFYRKPKFNKVLYCLDCGQNKGQLSKFHEKYGYI